MPLVRVFGVEGGMVTRQPIDVRRSGTGDVEDLLRLWSAAREDVGPMGRPLVVAPPEQVRARLQAVLLGPDVHVLIARWEGRPAGYTLVRVVPVAALVEGLAVQIEQLYVVPELRRRGIARALLAAVTGIAERAGAEQVVSSAPPGARDSNRFLARLGFSPVVVRRVVATSVLRRKLAGEGCRSGLEDLLSRRRSLRARAGWPRRDTPVPLLADELTGDDAEQRPADDAEPGPADDAEPGPADDAEPAPAEERPCGVLPHQLGEPLPPIVRHEAVAGSSTSPA